MKKLTLLLALLALPLSACAPLAPLLNGGLDKVQGQDPATFTGAGTLVATFDPAGVAEDAGLYLRDAGLTTTDKRCRPDRAGWDCLLGTVNTVQTVTFTGESKLSTGRLGVGFATFLRKGGYVLKALE